jgi:hypothetical protein
MLINELQSKSDNERKAPLLERERELEVARASGNSICFLSLPAGTVAY